MKKQFLLVSVCMFFFLVSMGQGGNDGLLEKCCIDHQTGDTIRRTIWSQVNSSRHKCLLNFRMMRRNSVFTLEFSYHFGSGDPFSVRKGDSIWIKFIDGKKIVLYARENVQSHKGMAKIPGALDGSVTFGISVRYTLSQKQLSCFFENHVEKVRIFNQESQGDIFWPEQKRSLTVQAAKQMTGKITDYPYCEPDQESGVNTGGNSAEF